jgi:hypothetical protein
MIYITSKAHIVKKSSAAKPVKAKARDQKAQGAKTHDQKA